MWFVMLAVALALIVVAGLYLRRRLGEALATLGRGPRAVRVARALTAWLLFGYPLVMVVAVAVTLATGAATMPRFDGPLATWLLVYPFFVAVLILGQALPWLGAIELGHYLWRRRRGPARAGRARAWAVIAVIAAFAIYTPARIVLERDALRVRHYRLGPGAASAGAGFRIVFLADLQQDRQTDRARAAQVVGLANAAGADLVLAGGDWINTGPDYIAAAAASAGALRSRLGTFSVVGDHEHFAYVDRARSVREVEAALAEHGVSMVRDQVRWFTHQGRRIGVLFLEHNYLTRTDGATIDAGLAALAGADFAIVVTHQFDAAIAARVRGRVDLVLAGHTHGGQLNPVLGLVHVSPARIETPYVDGRSQLGATTVIVTAGIGYSLVPFRYASPPSLEVIDLVW